MCRRTKKGRRRYRALNPWAEADAALLAFVAKGEWAVQGFRSRDPRAALYPKLDDAKEGRRLAGRVPRRLALLRAHKLIRKVQGSHRYLLSPKGREIVTALLAARQASIPQLLKLAA